MIQVSISLNGAVTNQGQFADQATADQWVLDNSSSFPEGFTRADSDITAQLASAQAVHDAHQYLKSSDWYVVRFADTGIAIPADVKAQRATARLTINPPQTESGS